jgi:hypothetical protein
MSCPECAMSPFDQKKSALKEHFQEAENHICIENIEFIAKMEHYGKREIREAI